MAECFLRMFWFYSAKLRSQSHYPSFFGIVSFLLVVLAPLASAEVKLVGSPAMRMPASSDSTEAILHLQSDQKERVSLSLGELVNKSTKEVLPIDVTFDPSTLDMEPDRIFSVKVSVSKVYFEGEAEADILSQGVSTGVLRIARSGLEVSLVGGAEIFFRKGEGTVVQLRNDSRYRYELGWMVQIGGEKYCGSNSSCEMIQNWKSVVLPPKGMSSVEIDPPSAWFGWFGQQNRDATLWLAFPGALPTRAIAFQAKLRDPLYPDHASSIVLWLALGALFSLIVRHWVPNSQRKRELKDQIRQISNKIAGISTEIDATLRVLVREHCNWLDVLQKSMYTIMPDYTTIAQRCGQAIALLERRVDLIEEIDTVYEQLSTWWESCPPPSQIDRVEDLLRNAQEPLKKVQPQETDFLEVQKRIEKARSLTERMGTPDPDFGKELATRLTGLRAEMCELKKMCEPQGEDKNIYKCVSEKLPGPFAFLKSKLPENIPEQRYSLVDYELETCRIIRDYIWAWEGSTSDAQKKLKAIEPLLIEHLAHKSWNELRLARLLLEQFRENSDESTIKDAINNSVTQMDLEQEPVEVHFGRTVQFRVRFRRPELNWSPARELFKCEWDFGGDDGSTEKGWTTSYFYRDQRSTWKKLVDWGKRMVQPQKFKRPEYAVRVRFVDKEGNIVSSKDNEGKSIESLLKRPVKPQPDPQEDRWTRSFNEFIGLLVSIFVPLISLIAVAREQLQQDTAGGAMTIFLLGFSSEAIISVFKQRLPPQ